MTSCFIRPVLPSALHTTSREDHDPYPSLTANLQLSKRRVTYFYDSEVGNYHYCQGHMMKPHRVRMTHSLIVFYEMYKHMEVLQPRPLPFSEMTRFHSDDYINFLRTITPRNMKEYQKQCHRFNVGEDCPEIGRAHV